MSAKCVECGEDFPAYPWSVRSRCWRCRLIHVEGVEPPTPDCGHLDEYKIDGDCMRCEQAFNTKDERTTSRGVL